MRARPFEIGFTGTQRGMTDPPQVEALIRILSTLGDARLHHGDCIGADEKAHRIATELLIPIVIHPPINPSKRARCALSHKVGGVIWPTKTYRERNRDIVEQSEALIACPGEDHEELRSGTWMTVRMARKLGRPITIIWPNGDERHENGGVLA